MISPEAAELSMVAAMSITPWISASRWISRVARG